MKKKAFTNATATSVVNGYILRSFAWTIHDPNNINTASISAAYDLAYVDAAGLATASDAPGHRGILVGLHNVGDNQALSDWLAECGHPNDPLSFDYHDIERLVETDATARFGLSLSKK